MKRTFLILLLGTFATCLSAGTEPQANFVKSGDIFGLRVFVENKGQFDNEIESTEKIHYAYICNEERMYFTPKGVIYQHVKYFPLTENQKEAQERGEHIFAREPEVHYVRMNWVNSNPNVQIESSEKQSHYLSYWSANLISNTYKKITYRNIYNNIDIEYTIPAD